MSTAPKIALEDLDRDELLLLIKRRCPFFTAQDLWSARWDVISKRALADEEAEGKASSEYVDALCAFNSPGLEPSERARRANEAAVLRTKWQLLEKNAKAARAAEREAWAALEAGQGK